MKKLLLLSFFSFIIHFANAQYRGYPTYDQLGNPGNSLKQAPTYYFGQGPIGHGTVPQWSNVIQIGFPFLFNGQPVTAFKVSTTGVITFDTNAVIVPPAMHATLPNQQIPNNSICILGITNSCLSNNGSVINYRVVKTDDRANPLRQFYISFSAYSDTITTNHSRVTDWTVLLEEGTNNIYIIDEIENGITPNLTLGIQINANTAYMMPGSPNIGGHTPADYDMFDNYYYTFEPISSVPIDGTVRTTNFCGYADINDMPYSLKAEFRNLGTATVTSYRLNYSVNGGPVVSEMVSNTNLDCGRTEWVTFSSTITVPDTGEYQIDVWADQINGFSDQYVLNDHLQQRLYVAPALPKRRVMCEEFKSTTCLWSGYWTQRYDSLLVLSNKNKASSIKYEQFSYQLRSQDLWARERLLNYFAVPTAYANGQFLRERASTLYTACPHLLTQHTIDSLYDLPGLFDIQPHLEINGVHLTVSAGINSKVRFPPSNLAIFVALYQDTILAPAMTYSGDSCFVNTTRRFYPDGNGIFIGAPVFGQYDTLAFTDTITDASWFPQRLWAVVFVQDTITREIFQCAEIKANNTCLASMNSTIHRVCAGDSILLNGIWRTSDGNYPSIYNSVIGCDSLQMDIVWGTSSRPRIVPFGGQLYINSWGSNYNDTLTWAWYDSTTHQMFPVTTTSPFTPPGPGVYAVIATNQLGCSNYSNYVHYCSPVYSAPQVYHICEGDTVYLDDRKFYSNTNANISFTQADGCGDSIIPLEVIVHNVNNTITYANGILTTPAGPSTYQWFECDGTILSGQTSNTLAVDTITGGSYYCLVTDTGNCFQKTPCYTIWPYSPQIVQNTVNVCPGDSVTINGQIYSHLGGPFTDTLTNSFGFDSVAIITVTNNAPDPTISTAVDSIVSHAVNVNYQWMDCTSGLPLSGFTNQVFFPGWSGSYAVILTDGYCIDTSTCLPFLWTNMNIIESEKLLLYPNPSSGTLNIVMPEKSASLEVYDISGTLVLFTNIEADNALLDVSKLTAGSYLMRIRTTTETYNRVFIKQ